MTATAPLVAVIIVSTVAMLLGSAFSASSLISDAYADLNAPSNVLEMPLFVFDFLLAFLQIAFAMLTWDYGFPPTIRFIVATIANTILVVSIVALFK